MFELVPDGFHDNDGTSRRKRIDASEKGGQPHVAGGLPDCSCITEPSCFLGIPFLPDLKFVIYRIKMSIKLVLQLFFIQDARAPSRRAAGYIRSLPLR